MSTLAIHTYGQGRPLVLLHGWGFDSSVWQPILEDLLALPNPYQLILVDLPGFGHSPPMTWDMFKTCLMAHLPSKSMMLGWSLGGLYATKFALEAPQCVEKLLLVTSTPYFMQTEDWPGIVAQTLDNFYHQFEKDPQKTQQQFIRSQLPQHAHNDLLSTSNMASLEGLKLGLSMLKHWDLRKHLIHLPMPMAYLFGRLDRIVSSKTAASLALHHPQAHCTILPYAAHLPFLSHRTDFITWLQEVGE